MATHSGVLAWRIPGMAEPSGLPSMGLHRVGHHWSDLAAAAAFTYWLGCFLFSNQFMTLLCFTLCFPFIFLFLFLIYALTHLYYLFLLYISNAISFLFHCLDLDIKLFIIIILTTFSILVLLLFDASFFFKQIASKVFLGKYVVTLFSDFIINF